MREKDLLLAVSEESAQAKASSEQGASKQLQRKIQVCAAPSSPCIFFLPPLVLACPSLLLPTLLDFQDFLLGHVLSIELISRPKLQTCALV